MRPFTVEDQEEWYAGMRKDKNRFVFAIRVQENSLLIGSCSLSHLHWQARIAEIGIMIGNHDYHGKGFGTDTMQVLMRYGFMELNLNRIELGVNSYNPRAIHAYEKLGFRHEARVRETVFRDGEYTDSIWMAILRREWEASL